MLIEHSLPASWAPRFTSERQGVVPVVLLGDFRSRTMEYIGVSVFVRDLANALT